MTQTSPGRASATVGLYVDIPFVQRGEGVAANVPFVLFLGELSRHLERLVVFGRLAEELDEPLIALEGGEIEFVALPHYPGLTKLPGVIMAFAASRRVFTKSLDQLDAVWLFGPHPLAILFAHAAKSAGLPIVLGVRQDFLPYVRRRLPSAAWRPLMVAAQFLDWEFRRLARRAPAVVAGAGLSRQYRRSPHLIDCGFSLVAAGDLVEAAADLSIPEEPVILSVGRLDPEKNPMLLADVLNEVVQLWPGARLRVIGDGALADELSDRARTLSVRDRLCLVGRLPYGDQLRAEYRNASILLHISWTEGLPQVLFEAMAAGLPIVATDVGGVAQALDAGSLGILVPPGNALVAAKAITSLLGDPIRRSGMVGAALAVARGQTMAAQAARIAALFDDVVQSSR